MSADIDCNEWVQILRKSEVVKKTRNSNFYWHDQPITLFLSGIMTLDVQFEALTYKKYQQGDPSGLSVVLGTHIANFYQHLPKRDSITINELAVSTLWAFLKMAAVGDRLIMPALPQKVPAIEGFAVFVAKRMGFYKEAIEATASSSNPSAIDNITTPLEKTFTSTTMAVLDYTYAFQAKNSRFPTAQLRDVRERLAGHFNGPTSDLIGNTITELLYWDYQTGRLRSPHPLPIAKPARQSSGAPRSPF